MIGTIIFFVVSVVIIIVNYFYVNRKKLKEIEVLKNKNKDYMKEVDRLQRERINDDNFQKFAYEQLREEVSRNTQINYTIITIFFTASLLMFVQAIVSNIDWKETLLTGCFSAFLFIVALVIDRRLTAYNNIRRVRMAEIELALGFENIRLTTDLVPGKNGFNTTRDNDIRVIANAGFLQRISIGIGRTSNLMFSFFGVILIVWVLLVYIRIVSFVQVVESIKGIC